MAFLLFMLALNPFAKLNLHPSEVITAVAWGTSTSPCVALCLSALIPSSKFNLSTSTMMNNLLRAKIHPSCALNWHGRETQVVFNGGTQRPKPFGTQGAKKIKKIKNCFFFFFFFFEIFVETLTRMRRVSADGWRNKPRQLIKLQNILWAYLQIHRSISIYYYKVC